jgi:hypothetical protein
MRALFGVGTPRGLQGRAVALLATLWSLYGIRNALHDEPNSILAFGVAN